MKNRVKIIFFSLIISFLFCNYSYADEPVNETAPVSYTHLDVYKRQRYDDERITGLLNEFSNRIRSVIKEVDISGFEAPKKTFGKSGQ